jgi:uncharacterized damage-inducible protein DinB
MASTNEIDRFRTVWNMEAEKTLRLLEALPQSQYDFRPDPKGRSMGELAWHLSEIEGYISLGITKGNITFQDAPPNIQRPREVRLLAPGYRRIHEEAVARLGGITDDQLDQQIQFVGQPHAIRDVLWGTILMHQIHHRGQLSLMCRLAGAAPPAIYGPNREEMEAMRERMRTVRA